MEDAQPQAQLLSEGTTSHEANRLQLRGLVYFAVALVGVTALVQLALAFVMQGFSREEKTLESMALPRFAGDTGEYPSPRIEADPATELGRMKAEDLGQLNGYGWVDRKAGVAHIPVDRAIEILAQKGLPTPEARSDQSKRGGESSTRGTQRTAETGTARGAQAMSHRTPRTRTLALWILSFACLATTARAAGFGRRDGQSWV